ncbi:NAD(P)/FAD-dependent oxidoreductase [Dactylosporangium sp. AC04546]|uniref:flavin-containing monooxygenase n=1 Tax=Dactylosporangium sp. AC04546 TaxID=2862460 RepID=UPI001EDCB575|nr:NAD(P)/FAD-dependent oxidoreductase [Dactylosporangium sp. AC04546]WVK86929.1 NAD(P)/FAD-dependent oxidoreductase [Dactylosporangium sp. AC04546]
MDEFDAVVIGAGFAGLYQLYRLRELGFTAQGFEAGSGVGGTWYWNRYPGARCDVESMDYSYSFSPELEQEWEWTERFPAQPEILNYLNFVADRLDLRRMIQFDTRVTSVVFDDETSRWTVETGEGRVISVRFVIAATGCLSVWQIPGFKGLESFRGATYHTGSWPHEGVDFTGMRVGVIGTGSTGIQAIPQIAKQAAQLFVFQRTPNYSVPARNHPLTAEYQAHRKATYREYRERAKMSGGGHSAILPTTSALEVTDADRWREYERRWQMGGAPLMQMAYTDLMANPAANETIAEFVRSKIREIVKDPEVAAKLTPVDYPFGAKRLCVDIDYFETYNRDNVTLVDVRDAPIDVITPRGIVTGGQEYELDAIVFATGYDAMTGPLLNLNIRGRAGAALRDVWSEGPRAYLGIQVAGFPNLFTITGPGSPSVLSNMVVSIEQHVDFVSDCLSYLREHDIETMEPTVQAQDAWVDHVNSAANETLFPLAKSWYLGDNIPGKPRVFMPFVGGVGIYRRKCDEVVAGGYEGFVLAARQDRQAAGR